MNKVVWKSEKMDWCTPDSVFDPLDKEFGFNLDAAATTENSKCGKCITPEEDALTVCWKTRSRGGSVWLNPPYGRGLGDWFQKASEESEKGCTVVMLLPARTDTKYWHEYVFKNELGELKDGVECRFLKGRIKFIGAQNGAPFPSAIIIFRRKEVKSCQKGH